MLEQDYPHQIGVDLRYGDTDRQGHINNAVFATLFESGRVDFLVDAENAMPPIGYDFVIAEITIKFLGEMHFPGRVDVMSKITRLGNSSFELEQALEFDGKITASATSVVVLMDRTTRKSAPLDDATRTYLTHFMAK